MIDCQTYKDTIAAHVDGELTAEENSEIEAHLGRCVACTRLFRWETETKKILRRKIPRVPASPDLREKVLRRLPEKARESQPFWTRLLETPAWVPAVALLVVFSVPYFRGQREQSPDLFTAAVQRYKTVTRGSGNTPGNLPSSTMTARLLDLSPWGYRLLTKSSEGLRGREGRIFVYEGQDQSFLLAQEFEGTELELPQNVEKIPTASRNFLSYSQSGITVVAWKEKEFVCMIAGALPKEKLLGLAKEITTGA